MRRRRRNPWYVVDRWGTVQSGPQPTQDDARAVIRAYRAPADLRKEWARRSRVDRSMGLRVGWRFKTFSLPGKYRKGSRPIKVLKYAGWTDPYKKKRKKKNPHPKRSRKLIMGRVKAYKWRAAFPAILGLVQRGPGAVRRMRRRLKRGRR